MKVISYWVNDNLCLFVEYDYTYDPGVWTLSNGDPGWPEYEEVDIASIKCSGVDITDIVNNDLINKIEEYISKIEGEGKYGHDE